MTVPTPDEHPGCTEPSPGNAAGLGGLGELLEVQRANPEAYRHLATGKSHSLPKRHSQSE